MALPAILAVIGAVSSLLGKSDDDEKQVANVEKLGDIVNTVDTSQNLNDAVNTQVSKNYGSGSTGNFWQGLQTAQTIGGILSALDSGKKQKQPYYYQSGRR